VTAGNGNTCSKCNVDYSTTGIATPATDTTACTVRAAGYSGTSGGFFPSSQPSAQPTRQPTGQPSDQPGMQPSGQPSEQPTSPGRRLVAVAGIRGYKFRKHTLEEHAEWHIARMLGNVIGSDGCDICPINTISSAAIPGNGHTCVACSGQNQSLAGAIECNVAPSGQPSGQRTS
jgi:hypothetical protein